MQDTSHTDNTEWITTKVAAAALGVEPRRIRSYISEGKLEAKSEGEGVNKRYLVSVAGVETLRAELQEDEQHNDESRLEVEYPRQDADGSASAPSRIAEKIAVELARGFTADLSEARYKLGRAEARLELATLAEGALQEQLLRERERVARLEAERDRLLPDLLRERDRANAERERAEHFEDELRVALEARRGWFRRFFGF